MSTQGVLELEAPSKEHAGCASGGSPPDRNSPVRADRKLPSWLGLVTNHRRLFDAGQDGWLRPLPRSGFVLGHECFVSEDISTGRNIVPVRLAFAVDKLPFPDARGDLERRPEQNGDGDEPRAVHWRAPLPLYAVEKVEVSTTDQKARLVAMAERFSNVCLPSPNVAVGDCSVLSPPPDDSAVPGAQPLELPETLNAIHGAMAMAVWAVPRVEPWMEILKQALALDTAGVADGTRRLDARWLQLPWLALDPSAPAPDSADDQEGLWRAALRCMQWSTVGVASPDALAERIVQVACRDGTNRTAKVWLDRIRRIVSAEEPISCDGWRRNGAGLAVQLALLRPDPSRFKSWSRDLPGLPPAVWWAAATLCGWRHGYRELDRKFRGDASLREFLSSRALAASWPGGDSAALIPSQRSPLERMCEEGCFALTWRGHTVLRKPWQSRARWYGADLTDGEVGKAARTLADRMEWPCLERRLTLPEGRVTAIGSGHLLTEGDTLVVKGKKSLRLPYGVDIEERFSPDTFRRLLAIEAGDIPDPPEASPHRQGHEIPGLVYVPEFITEAEEKRLLACIDRAEWSTDLQRRVQHYGWRYDYKQRQVDDSMRLGELPEWTRELAGRLVNEGFMKDPPDQVIVNEYRGKQGISRHIDQPHSFTEHVATISLIETWGMVFRRRDRKEKVEIPLERRSVAVMTGDARYKWTHEIPKRKYESLPDRQGKRRRVARGRRVSLTFRTSRAGSSRPRSRPRPDTRDLTTPT